MTVEIIIVAVVDVKNFDIVDIFWIRYYIFLDYGFNLYIYMGLDIIFFEYFYNCI